MSKDARTDTKTRIRSVSRWENEGGASAGRARDTAETRADAIRAADRNVAGMTPEQRDAIVANQAPAVR